MSFPPLHPCPKFASTLFPLSFPLRTFFQLPTASYPFIEKKMKDDSCGPGCLTKVNAWQLGHGRKRHAGDYHREKSSVPPSKNKTYNNASPSRWDFIWTTSIASLRLIIYIERRNSLGSRKRASRQPFNADRIGTRRIGHLHSRNPCSFLRILSYRLRSFIRAKTTLIFARVSFGSPIYRTYEE